MVIRQALSVSPDYDVFALDIRNVDILLKKEMLNKSQS
jgi:hypothetical protein